MGYPKKGNLPATFGWLLVCSLVKVWTTCGKRYNFSSENHPAYRLFFMILGDTAPLDPYPFWKYQCTFHNQLNQCNGMAIFGQSGWAMSNHFILFPWWSNMFDTVLIWSVHFFCIVLFYVFHCFPHNFYIYVHTFLLFLIHLSGQQYEIPFNV